MKDINYYVREMNYLEANLCTLNEANEENSKFIRKMSVMKKILAVLVVALIPYLIYFIKVTNLAIFSNAYLLGAIIATLGSLSCGFVILGKDIKETNERKSIYEEKIEETKKQLKSVTIKHDNCLANNLEKNNVILYENRVENKVENTNQKAKAYMRLLRKDNK